MKKLFYQKMLSLPLFMTACSNFKNMIGGVAIIFAILTVTEAGAQTRKKNTTASRKVTTTTTTQKAVTKKPVVNTIAIYTNTHAKAYSIGNKYIYYVEDNNNNAVIGINRITGERETIVPGIAGIYEGARMQIKEVHASGDQLFLVAMDRKKEYYVYLFDGKSFETSTYLKDWGYIIKCSNKAAFIINQKETYELWDTKTMEKVASYGLPKGLSDWYQHPKVYISSDNTIWFTGSDWNHSYGASLKRIDTKGSRTEYDLSKEPYSVKNDLNGSFGQIYLVGDSIYVPYARRVYRMNALHPGQWEEYAKVPVNENKKFELVWADSKGNFLTKGSAFADYNIEYYRAEALDSPKALGRDSFKSGLPEDFSTWSYQSVYPGNCLVDSSDNFIMRGDNTIYIFNPNGIVGYSKAIGKIIK